MTLFYADGTLRPDMIEDIRRDVRRSNDRLHRAGLDSTIWADEDRSNLLPVKPAGEWLRQESATPPPKCLFGDFWLEGELCILFADTNLGKSILAVQIGNHIAAGTSFQPFNNYMPRDTPVLYIDFEMGARQFGARYSDEKHGGYRFENTFYRAEFNNEANNPALYKNYEDFLANNLDRAITRTKARVLIIDNLTYMRSGTERAKDALPLMKHLKALKTKHQLSILALAHTPKRSITKPITVNDLQGSKMLINFCDSAFAIGASHTVPGGRYLKQIKQRNAKQQYGDGNVCLCRIVRNFNNIYYEFIDHATEREHLQPYADTNNPELQQQAGKLKEQGQSYRSISRELQVSLGTVFRWLNEGGGKQVP